MSCVNPNYIRVGVDDLHGTLTYKFKGAARYEDARDFGSFEDLASRGYFDVLIPCRHCLGCRIDYSRQWANRMCLELKDNPVAIFVTLTYDNEHLPLVESTDPVGSGSDFVATLSKRDFQLFFKRLRKAFPDKRIRYYLAGEYGKKFTKRPHGHAIIYGLGLSDFPDLYFDQYNKLGQPLFRSDTFEKIWQGGRCSISEVNYQTCAYVARYTLKKHYGESRMELFGALPEFNLSSRRPGIGLSQYEKIISSDSDYVTFRTSDGVHTIPIPKAIVRTAREHNISLDKCIDYSYTRLETSSKKLESELAWSEKSFHDYLCDNYKSLRDRIKLLEER